MRWEWREWSLDGLKDVEPYEVMQALTTGQTIRKWLSNDVLGVLGGTARGRVLLIALYEDIDSWVVVGARAATREETATYRRAFGRSS